MVHDLREHHVKTRSNIKTWHLWYKPHVQSYGAIKTSHKNPASMVHGLRGPSRSPDCSKATPGMTENQDDRIKENQDDER